VEIEKFWIDLGRMGIYNTFVCYPTLDVGSLTLNYTRYYQDPGSKAGMIKYSEILL